MTEIRRLNGSHLSDRYLPFCEQKGQACRRKLSAIWILGAALLLSGCFDESNDSGRSFGNGGGTAVRRRPRYGGEQNQAPTIAGTPSANILEGELYEFLPTASDPEGDALEFSIARKPAWAQFDRASGRLWGTPGADDVGNFTNIAISVSDGKATADARGVRRFRQSDRGRHRHAFLEAADCRMPMEAR